MKSSKPGPVHDPFAREVFSDPPAAAHLVRPLVPPVLQQRIGWSELRNAGMPLIDEKLDERKFDLLFEAPFACEPEQGPGVALIYLLLEHQSDNCREMPLRISEYVVGILRKFHEHNQNLVAEQGLPIVVPVVVSHAQGGWSAPVSIDQMYKLGYQLRQDSDQFRPRIGFVLHDLAKMQLQEIQRYAVDAYRIFALWSMKYGRSRRVAELLYELSAVIKELLRTEEGRRHFRQVVCYLWKVAHESTHEPMLRSFNSIDPSGGEEVVTIWESVLEKGRKEGEEEGRKAGLEEGRAEGEEVGREKTANSVLRRLLRRFPEASPELLDRVRAAEVDELIDWAAAIEGASSVEDLLDA